MNGVNKKRKIYLDTNATTPLEAEVLTKITTVLRDHWANPSSCHQKGLRARGVIEEARLQVASMIGAQAKEILFTSGGTESNNLTITSAIHHFHQTTKLFTTKSLSYDSPSLLPNHPDSSPHPISSSNENHISLDGVGNGEGGRNGKDCKNCEVAESTECVRKVERVDNDECIGRGEGGVSREGVGKGEENRKATEMMPHIITSPLEHDSVRLTIKHLEGCGQAEVTVLGVVDGGVVDVEEVVNAIKDNTCFISLMTANNETGVLQPVREVGKRLKHINKERRLSDLPTILFHTDAAQAIGKVTVDVGDLGVDYLTIVGHKFYGPRIGALFHRNAPIYPMFYGGGQEKGLRPGTESTGMIAGLGSACQLVTLNWKKYLLEMRRVRDELERVMEEAFPGQIVIHGKNGLVERLPNTCNFSFKHPALIGKEVVDRLRVVVAGVGAACHSGLPCRPSPILLSCGVPNNLALNAIRLSVGRDTLLVDVGSVVEDFKQAVLSAMRDYEC